MESSVNFQNLPFVNGSLPSPNNIPLFYKIILTTFVVFFIPLFFMLNHIFLNVKLETRMGPENGYMTKTLDFPVPKEVDIFIRHAMPFLKSWGKYS